MHDLTIDEAIDIAIRNTYALYMEIDTYNDYKLAQKMFPRK